MDWICGWCRLCDCRLLLDTETHSWVSLQAPFYLLEHKLCRNLTNFSRKIAKNMFAYNYWYIRTVVVRLKCVWIFFICRQNVKMVCLRRCAVSQVFTAVKKKKRQTIFTVCRLVSEWGDSNARPLRPERSALPTALHSVHFWWCKGITKMAKRKIF